MGFCRDRPVRHGARGEPADDLRHRLDLGDRDWRAQVGAEPEETAQGRQVLGLSVDQCRVLLEDVVAPLPGGVLEAEDGLGVEEVVFALPSPLVLAAHLEGAVGALLGVVGEGQRMADGDLGGQDVEADATQPAHRSSETGVHDLATESDGLEDLCARVRGDRGDAHFGHHLEDPLVAGLHVVPARPVRLEVPGQAVLSLGDHPVDGFEGDVGAYGRGAEPEQEGDVVHLAGIAAFDEQADAGTGLFVDQVVVDGSDGEQGRNGRVNGVDAPVAHDQEAHPVGDRRRGLVAQSVESGCKSGPTLGDDIPAVEDHRTEVAGSTGLVDVDDAGQLRFGQDRVREVNLPARSGCRVEQVALRADGAADGRDEFFSYCIERRIRDLGEELREVVVERPGPVGQGGDGRIGAHRTEGLLGFPDHRRNEQLQLLVRESEDLLALDRRFLPAEVPLAVG